VKLAASERYIAIRLRRSSRSLLLLAALRGPKKCAALVNEAAYQLAEAERLAPMRRAS
jgi:hypothetical protein